MREELRSGSSSQEHEGAGRTLDGGDGSERITGKGKAEKEVHYRGTARASSEHGEE